MKREGRLTDAYRWQLTRVLPPDDIMGNPAGYTRMCPGDLVKEWRTGDPAPRFGIVVSTVIKPASMGAPAHPVITVLWST